jgi:hypothetical protein
VHLGGLRAEQGAPARRQRGSPPEEVGSAPPSRYDLGNGSQGKEATMRYTDDTALPEITEERFAELRQTARPYTLVILKAGPGYRPPGPDDPEATRVVMAHGKRNAQLHVAGLLPIVCPVSDPGEVRGIGIFDASPEDVERILSADPGVRAGLFTYEVLRTMSFPGSTLPAPDPEQGGAGLG